MKKSPSSKELWNALPCLCLRRKKYFSNTLYCDDLEWSVYIKLTIAELRLIFYCLISNPYQVWCVTCFVLLSILLPENRTLYVSKYLWQPKVWINSYWMPNGCLVWLLHYPLLPYLTLNYGIELTVKFNLSSLNLKPSTVLKPA